ncbi:MAG: hypothetical protein HWQ35_11380 [Nostoc sp. NMS1]|nr:MULTISPECIES: hypothetical protein [unclassified Nostoc]MBN3907130.1 hypothetical protein [Nostoc sp. NMS1]MBN3991062.1 hypothetical protein [Nostoc sp. NMS2]
MSHPEVQRRGFIEVKNKKIKARAKQKLEQVISVEGNLPAYIVVVEFCH